MAIFEDVETVPSTGRGRGTVDPEIVEFARSLLAVGAGNARVVALPEDTYSLVVREVERATRQLNMGLRATWEKTPAGKPVVQNGKVRVKFEGWVRKTRKPAEPVTVSHVAPVTQARKAVPPGK